MFQMDRMFVCACLLEGGKARGGAKATFFPFPNYQSTNLFSNSINKVKHSSNVQRH